MRAADLVQDLYIKELKAYKAPEAVRPIVFSMRAPKPSLG
jgi:hypothetical protein